MSDELKPCPAPWCPGEKRPALVYAEVFDVTYVRCPECDCAGPEVSGSGDSVEAEAITAWNQRAEPPRAAPDAEVDLLAWLGRNSSLQLSWEGWEDDVWQVHQVNGGRSDREWTKIAEGNTPREALKAALAAMQAHMTRAEPPRAAPDAEAGEPIWLASTLLMARQNTRIEALTAQLARARKYARHASSCWHRDQDVNGNRDKPCTCGLSTLLAELDKT